MFQNLLTFHELWALHPYTGTILRPYRHPVKPFSVFLAEIVVRFYAPSRPAVRPVPAAAIGGGRQPGPPGRGGAFGGAPLEPFPPLDILPTIWQN